MCIDNKHLKDKVPRGNGTICRVLKIKLKQDAPSHKWKNFYGKKVWTVNASDVEYVECEHVHKTGRMLQLETQIKNWMNQLEQDKHQDQADLDKIRVNIDKSKTMLSTIMNERKFKLEPEICLPKISIKQFRNSPRPIEFQCKMKQVQANRNDYNGTQITRNIKRCNYNNVLAYRRISSNVQKLGIRCSIPSTNTIRIISY